MVGKVNWKQNGSHIAILDCLENITYADNSELIIHDLFNA